MKPSRRYGTDNRDGSLLLLRLGEADLLGL
jgi:hypothetical protein